MIYLPRAVEWQPSGWDISSRFFHSFPISDREISLNALLAPSAAPTPVPVPANIWKSLLSPNKH